MTEDGQQQSEPVENIPEKAAVASASSANGVEDGLENSPRWRSWRRRRRVLLAYQWRSERTGRALLAELDTAFEVREITPEVWRR